MNGILGFLAQIAAKKTIQGWLAGNVALGIINETEAAQALSGALVFLKIVAKTEATKAKT